jgi:hypothetical protein
MTKIRNSKRMSWITFESVDRQRMKTGSQLLGTPGVEEETKIDLM